MYDPFIEVLPSELQQLRPPAQNPGKTTQASIYRTKLPSSPPVLKIPPHVSAPEPKNEALKKQLYLHLQDGWMIMDGWRNTR